MLPARGVKRPAAARVRNVTTPSPRQRAAVDRLLRLTLTLAKRIDPTMTGLHGIRAVHLPGLAMQVIEDECVPPETGYVGNSPAHFTAGVTVLDIPR